MSGVGRWRYKVRTRQILRAFDDGDAWQIVATVQPGAAEHGAELSEMIEGRPDLIRERNRLIDCNAELLAALRGLLLDDGANEITRQGRRATAQAAIAKAEGRTA